jgi:hypothetical protein
MNGLKILTSLPFGYSIHNYLSLLEFKSFITISTESYSLDRKKKQEIVGRTNRLYFPFMGHAIA